MGKNFPRQPRTQSQGSFFPGCLGRLVPCSTPDVGEASWSWRRFVHVLLVPATGCATMLVGSSRWQSGPRRRMDYTLLHRERSGQSHPAEAGMHLLRSTQAGRRPRAAQRIFQHGETTESRGGRRSSVIAPRPACHRRLLWPSALSPCSTFSPYSRTTRLRTGLTTAAACKRNRPARSGVARYGWTMSGVSRTGHAPRHCDAGAGDGARRAVPRARRGHPVASHSLCGWCRSP